MSETFMERQLALRTLIALSSEHASQAPQWRERIADKYRELAERLPGDDPWKTAAFENAIRSEKLFYEIAPILGCNDLEAQFIGMLVFTQGLGRLEESLRKRRGEFMSSWNHGVGTISVLREILPIETSETPLWRASFVAIRHRSDPVTLVRDITPVDDFSQATFALVTLLRDCVKREAFTKERLESNLSDDVTKARLREMNWSVEARERNPALGTEQGRIEPKTQLDAFCAHKPLIRAECESYEALMLQILAYLFDVTHPEFVELIVKEGGPRSVYAYLEKQLASFSQHLLIVQALVRWNHSLARVILDV